MKYVLVHDLLHAGDGQIGDLPRERRRAHDGPGDAQIGEIHRGVGAPG